MSEPELRDTSREKDMVIAIEGFGWQNVRPLPPDGEWHGQPPGRDDTNYVVPRYSTDVGALVEGIKSLREDRDRLYGLLNRES